MPNICEYRDCTARKKKDPSITFHRFPTKNEHILNKWVFYCGKFIFISFCFCWIG